MSDDQEEHQLRRPAPATAHYEELNVFGSPTGAVVHVREGDRLPGAPRGFTWRRTQTARPTQPAEAVGLYLFTWSSTIARGNNRKPRR